jgi:TetR/AcrR family transcriptional regulator, transcriptional repressor of aconitase
MADDHVLSKGVPAPAEAEPARRGRGRPVGDREGRRAELLEAAMKVIGEEGIAAASLRRVAQRAGCTTGAVSYYFANKEAMMAALIESRFDLFDKLLELGDDAAGVRRSFERWFEITTVDEAVWTAGFQLLAYARHEPLLAAAYQRRYARYREVFARILASGQQQGWVRRDVPADLLADQLSAMGDGWMMLYPIEPERFEPKRVKALLDATMAIIAPPVS